jgi:hypothetical protein
MFGSNILCPCTCSASPSPGERSLQLGCALGFATWLCIRVCNLFFLWLLLFFVLFFVVVVVVGQDYVVLLYGVLGRSSPVFVKCMFCPKL